MSKTVLVSGSDEAGLDFLVTFLTSGGVAAVSSPASSAASAVIQHDPAVVVIDAVLDPVRSIRALADPKQAAVPIVVLGSDGASDQSHSANAIAAGANHFVGRPVPSETLLTGIQTILSSL